MPLTRSTDLVSYHTANMIVTIVQVFRHSLSVARVQLVPPRSRTMPGTPTALPARRVLADPEGASLTGITSYLAYVTKGCGDPAAAQGECLQLKGSFCGARDTSEVLCRAGKDATAQFRSSSRWAVGEGGGGRRARRARPRRPLSRLHGRGRRGGQGAART